MEEVLRASPPLDRTGGRGYDFYLGRMRLPVPPSKCELRIKNKNETMTLLSGREVSLLKDPGLTEISFKCLLPQVRYPFAVTPFRGAETYLAQIERLKLAKRPFQFIVSRVMPGGRVLFSTNMTVSLEEYTIVEEAENGFDVTVDIHLRQYEPFRTRTVDIKLPQNETQTQEPVLEEQPARPPSTVQPAKPITIGCEVILNGQVFRDSYGRGPGATFSNYRGHINFINAKGSHPYHVATPAGGWLGWVTAGSVQAV